MPENIQVTKLERADAEKMDRSKMGVAVVNPSQADVEAQAHGWALVTCPWCLAVVRLWYDTNAYHWYTCGNCGEAFQA